MRKVHRDEIQDYVTYGETRDAVRQLVIEQKRRRRVHLGPYLTFLFENRDTVRYQVQEMMRTEQIVKESDIVHELATYNELLGGPGVLGCTLLIEIDEAKDRAPLLRRWLPLPQHLYAKLADGTRVPARFDPRQVGDTRLSAVQYLQFDTGGQVPVALGTDFSELAEEVPLSEEQRAALGEDLRDS